MPRKSHTENKNIKSVRWEAILKLIGSEKIGTQQELAKRLNADGYDVTQATVSRDIKDLKLVKTALSEGGYCYKVSHDGKNVESADKFYSLYKTAAIRIDAALNQVVVHCLNGMASAVCAAMDSMNFDEVIGTIAGDDTILIVTRSEKAASEFVRRLRSIK